MSNPYEAVENAAAEPISFWRRFRIPLLIVLPAAIFELVNWTTNVTAEVLLPQFATSGKIVLGRLVAQAAVVLLLIWLWLTRTVPKRIKYAVFVVVAVVGGAYLACVREIENTGNNNYVIHYRWEKTQDQRLAEFDNERQATEEPFALDLSAPTMTDFLGPNRDGVVGGPALETDWQANPPKTLWRRPVGSGYAGFVIAGGLAVTMEQRGEEEVVVAMDLSDGHDVWTRAYPGHFKESLGGNGPRATPTIAGEQVYALGAAGTLAALDLATGNQLWMTNILSDAQADNITWGMSGAPLVTQDLVIVNPGGKKEKGLIAYDRNTGEIKWTGGSSQAGYSSPVLMQLCGIEQVVIFDAQGVAGHDLANGRQLWRFTFETFEGINVCQPILVPEDRVFVSAGYNSGAVLLQITFNGKEWMAEPVWKNKNMKCKMGSCILHDGHIYGLDDAIFACLNAETGKRNWKGGRYGHGQFLLRGDCLVIQAENGDLVLCAPDPREHRELAKLPMLPGGKTWNPPALAGNLLLLRNHFEAVLLQLPIRDASSIESSPAN